MSDELDEIRRKRLRELQEGRSTQTDEELRQQQEEAARAFEEQKQAILRTILTDEAKQRLNNLKLVKPEFAVSIENQLVQIAQSGRTLRNRISEEQLLQMLRQIQDRKRESKIRFKRV